MSSLPTTPDNDAAHAMEVSDEDDLLDITGTFKIVNMAGGALHLRFDEMTSVGWALRQALDSPDPEWFKTQEERPKEGYLCKGRKVLRRLATKIYDVFDGYEEDNRVLTFVAGQAEEGA